MGFKPLKPGQDDRSSPSLHDLDERIREARSRRDDRDSGGEGSTRGSGLSLALRIGVELVAALVVGVGIGVLLDRWWGTSPWMLLAFFLLGAAAGILNVFRVMQGFDSSVGYRKAGETEAKRPGPEEGDE